MELHLAELWALVSVIAIDLTLALDNAVVMGVIAAQLPANARFRAVAMGTIAAAFFRILFAIFATKLLHVFGLILVGGLLLLWVSWKMWRELRHSDEQKIFNAQTPIAASTKSAVIQILLTDLSMSLDNILAVAGAARDHVWILIFGLTFSVLSVGFVAHVLAKLLEKHRWISYVGLAIVLYTALSMMWEGAHTVINQSVP